MGRSNIKRDSPELIKDTVHGLQKPRESQKRYMKRNPFLDISKWKQIQRRDIKSNQREQADYLEMIWSWQLNSQEQQGKSDAFISTN